MAMDYVSLMEERADLRLSRRELVLTYRTAEAEESLSNQRAAAVRQIKSVSRD